MKARSQAAQPAVSFFGNYLGGWEPIPPGPRNAAPSITLTMTPDGLDVQAAFHPEVFRGVISPDQVRSLTAEVATPDHARGWTITGGLIFSAHRVAATTFLAIDLLDGRRPMFLIGRPPFEVEAFVHPLIAASRARQPSWHPDPTGRHEMRYWDGARWTDHVSDAGVQSVDPPG
jgi:uncharacterized protein DUF2510